MQQIKQDTLQSLSKIPSRVKEHLENFNEDMFTIRHLFMDFQDANIANYDMKKSKFPISSEMIARQTITILQLTLQNYFKSLEGSDNPYILGYSIEEKRANNSSNIPPTFIPTGCTFSTFYDSRETKNDEKELSTLNFLLVTDNKKLPTSDRSGIFDKTWMQPTNNAEGCFVIGEIFINWLLPKIKELLLKPFCKEKGEDGKTNIMDKLKEKMNLSQISTGWNFSASYEDEYLPPKGERTGDFYHVRNKWNLDCEMILSTDCFSEKEKNISKKAIIKLSGKIHRYHMHSGSGRCIDGDATQKWNCQIDIIAGTNGQIAFKCLDLKTPPPDIKIEQDFFSNFFNSIFGNHQVGNWFRKEFNEVTNELEKEFPENLNIRFILPAGNIFFFKNTCFDDAVNLLLEVTYKRENPSLHQENVSGCRAKT